MSKALAFLVELPGSVARTAVELHGCCARVSLAAALSRGSGSACESDGDDSDGQGAPQGGGGVQSTPVSARAADILRGLRGLEASFMRK